MKLTAEKNNLILTITCILLVIVLGVKIVSLEQQIQINASVNDKQAKKIKDLEKTVGDTYKKLDEEFAKTNKINGQIDETLKSIREKVAQ